MGRFQGILLGIILVLVLVELVTWVKPRQDLVIQARP